MQVSCTSEGQYSALERTDLFCIATGIVASVCAWGGGGEVGGVVKLFPYLECSDGHLKCILVVRTHYTTVQILMSHMTPASLPHLVPPTFTATPPNVTIVEGAALNLTCSVYGDPPPTVQWLRGGAVLTPQGVYSIAAVSRSDSGVYTCTAFNPVGLVSADITLNVLCKCSAITLGLGLLCFEK